MKYPLASVSWDQAEYQAAMKVLSGNFYSMGEYTEKFESAYCDWSGSKYSVFCNSGSSANLLAVYACMVNPKLDLKPGNEVIVPSVSWSTTYTPLLQLGLKPVLVDIDPIDFNICIEEVKKSITNSTKAIFTVNLLGSPSKLDELKKICLEKNIILLEDNCESMGAELNGLKSGQYGNISTHSTFFSHHMATMEGGICCTDDELTYEILKSLRAHGWVRNVSNKELFYEHFPKPINNLEEKFHFVLPGFNFRPTEISAAIGLEQIKKLDDFLNNRRENAKYFMEKLSEFDDKLILQKEYGSSSWFGFGLVAESIEYKDKLVNSLVKHDIEVRPIVSGNIARQHFFKDYCKNYNDFSGAEKIHNQGFMIGNHQFDISEMIDHFFVTLKNT